MSAAVCAAAISLASLGGARDGGIQEEAKKDDPPAAGAAGKAAEGQPAKKQPEKKRPRVMQSHTIDDGLPWVLIIGDSISIGYTPFVIELLEDEANVVHAPGNNAGTRNGVAHIDEWLGDRAWDVIHFNFGLHDLKHVDPNDWNRNSQSFDDPRQAEPDLYRENLDRLVRRMKETGAELLFATTTPFPEGVKPARAPSDCDLYNQIALEIMKEHGAAVNDLCAAVKDRLEELQQPVNVHFRKEGSRFLAERVAKAIREALERRRERDRNGP